MSEAEDWEHSTSFLTYEQIASYLPLTARSAPDSPHRLSLTPEDSMYGAFGVGVEDCRNSSRACAFGMRVPGMSTPFTRHGSVCSNKPPSLHRCRLRHAAAPVVPPGRHRQPEACLGVEPAQHQRGLGGVDAQLQHRAPEAVPVQGPACLRTPLPGKDGPEAALGMVPAPADDCAVASGSTAGWREESLHAVHSKGGAPAVQRPGHATSVTCTPTPQANPAMARELFAAGFVSCWSELDDNLQDQLVRSLEAALASPTIPPDIVTALLNLAEFMEHDEKALPLDTRYGGLFGKHRTPVGAVLRQQSTSWWRAGSAPHSPTRFPSHRTLGALAEKCHAYAKALHYKEMEFGVAPEQAVEALISINNHLRQPDSAVGILTIAQNEMRMELKETW